MRKLDQLNSADRARAEKLLALVRQGVGGEAKNAETLLEKLLKQHGLTLDGIMDDPQPVVQCTVKYNHPYEKKLFSQVVYAVLDGKDFNIQRWNGTRTIFVEVSPMDRAEILLRYELYLRAFKEEIDTLMHAFIIKNRIYAASPSESTGPRTLTEKEQRAMEMSRGLNRVAVHKAIEGKS